MYTRNYQFKIVRKMKTSSPLYPSARRMSITPR